MRKTWSFLNKLLKGRSDRCGITLRDDQGIEHTDPKVVCDMFCNYFASVASNIDQNIPHSNTDPLDSINSVPSTF